MSSLADKGGVPGRGLRLTSRKASESTGAAKAITQAGASLLLVAAATLVAFVVQHLIATPNVTLIFVLPVVIAATFFGWPSALVAAVAGVLAFDFFFTEPYYSLRIASSSDLWAAALLLVIAAIVSTVAAESRRRAGEARRAAERAEAVQELAHAIIEGRPRRDVLQAGANALSRIFRAPAVVFVDEGGDVLARAVAGEAEVTEAVKHAARGALQDHVRTRGGAYPFDRCAFDLWPLAAPGSRGLVLGVDFAHGEEGRPPNPEPFIDVVGGYLSTELKTKA